MRLKSNIALPVKNSHKLKAITGYFFIFKVIVKLFYFRMIGLK
jgi:hypothetical protein